MRDETESETHRGARAHTHTHQQKEKGGGERRDGGGGSLYFIVGDIPCRWPVLARALLRDILVSVHAGAVTRSQGPLALEGQCRSMSPHS